jgi:hypothetical protein
MDQTLPGTNALAYQAEHRQEREKSFETFSVFTEEKQFLNIFSSHFFASWAYYIKLLTVVIYSTV